ncbi:hypothetical protein GQ54DRAFT_55372 [Martensiomyces pterosporus]|nr:hypothetical protein GQ54DRAFT_55372 [Martensiomyces pterosporus]
MSWHFRVQQEGQQAETAVVSETSFLPLLTQRAVHGAIMEAHASPLVPTANIQGIGRVVLPPQESLYQQFDRTHADASELTRNGAQGTEKDAGNDRASVVRKPWWQMLFVDAMLVPFVQGFMLNIAINWARHWRRSGGLVGVIRRRFAVKQ